VPRGWNGGACGTCQGARGGGGGGGGDAGGPPNTDKKEGATWGNHGFPHGSEPQASDAHAASAPSSASVEVEYSPLRNSSEPSTAIATSRVVGTPSTRVSPSARSARASAAGRSSSQTTSLAISES